MAYDSDYDFDPEIDNFNADLHQGKSEGQLLMCCGHRDYVKPALRDIWITEDLAEEPSMPPPLTLDEYDYVRKLSVLPKRYEQCIPSFIQDLLLEFNLIDKFFDKPYIHQELCKSEQNPLSGTHQTANEELESPSSSGSSVEILELNSEAASSIDIVDQPQVYHGDPVVYRKQDNANKTKNDRKGKKFGNQQKRLQKNLEQQNSLVLQETRNDLNNVPFYYSKAKQYNLNIGQQSDSEFRPEPSDHEFFKSCLKKNQAEALASAVNYPPLCTENNSIDCPLPPDTSSLTEYETIQMPTPVEPCVTGDGLVIMQNVPAQTSEKGLKDLFAGGVYGKIDILKSKTVGKMMTVLLNLGNESRAEWFVDCNDGEMLFGASSRPVRCFITHSSEI